MVIELLKNNAGCKLPCWWGIKPGLTSWQETRQFLERFTLLIDVQSKADDIEIAYFRIPFPKEAGSIDHIYTIRDEVIDTITVYNSDYAPPFYIEEFLANYGQPAEIMVRTFAEEENNGRPFLFELFYPDKGIMMIYSGGNLVDTGDKIRNCLTGLDSPFIILWSPDQEMTYQEVIGNFVNADLPPPLPLSEATGKSVELFYKEFIETKKLPCIETSKELWP
jgi:hypothetical protein